MTTTAGYLVHCRIHQWIDENPLPSGAAHDLAGTHDDDHHHGIPTATVVPLLGARLPLPVPHTGQRLALTA